MRADGSRDLRWALSSASHCRAVWQLLLESAGQAGSPSRAPTPCGQACPSWAATPEVRVIVASGDCGCRLGGLTLSIPPASSVIPGESLLSLSLSVLFCKLRTAECPGQQVMALCRKRGCPRAGSVAVPAHGLQAVRPPQGPLWVPTAGAGEGCSSPCFGPKRCGDAQLGLAASVTASACHPAKATVLMAPAHGFLWPRSNT